MKKEEMECQLVKLDEAYNLSYNLALNIIDKGYKPDLVVAIARGGFPVARYVCDFLDLHELASMRIKHYTAGPNQMEKADLKNPLNAEIKNRNVLIIDDVNDTGKTLRVAVDHLKGLQPKNIKVGVLHEKKESDFNADFVAEILKKWRWITYPWAMVEDVTEFLKKGENIESVEDAQYYLKSKYNIDITKEQLNKVFELKERYLETNR